MWCPFVPSPALASRRYTTTLALLGHSPSHTLSRPRCFVGEEGEEGEEGKEEEEEQEQGKEGEEQHDR